jgi:hypothetical protein
MLAHGISVRTRSFEAICPEHLSVIFAHERRVYSLPKAVFSSLTRYLVLLLMVGSVDEYIIDGRLVAFASTIVKGSALRAMWFYQRPECSHSLVWFHSVRLSLSRAAQMGLTHVDLGPSIDAGVAALKDKYGFASSSDWRDSGAYDGPFLHDLPPAAPVPSPTPPAPAVPPGPQPGRGERRTAQGSRKFESNGVGDSPRPAPQDVGALPSENSASSGSNSSTSVSLAAPVPLGGPTPPNHLLEAQPARPRRAPRAAKSAALTPTAAVQGPPPPPTLAPSPLAE